MKTKILSLLTTLLCLAVIGLSQAKTGRAVKEQILWRIDVGNTSSYTDSEGRQWSSDAGLFEPERAVPEDRGTPPIAGATDPTIYRTYRGNVGGKTPQSERYLTFRLPIKKHKRVNLRLHFAELYWGAPDGGKPGPGKRIFDVEANGVTLLKDFDITRETGAARTALVKEFKNVATKDGLLTLTFRAKIDFPSIAGIEVFSTKR